MKTTKLDAEVADLTYATIEGLEATNADIHNLDADYASFKSATTDKFTATDATIKKLDTDKLSVEDAKVTYANIDFSNIGEAAIEQFYAKSGVIQDIVISEGQVTGKLVGVTIKGDLIEGGTVVADKLVIQGEDGLYYKLNTNGETVSTEQTEYNSLSGTIITAKSITAEKVSVDDLVAFDATIGGFNITDNSIYSGVKNSVNNTTRGVYLDSEGQIAFGDSTDYIKYYKDTDGTYKLEISAKSIKFASSNKSVEEAISDVQTDVDNLENTLEETNSAIQTQISETATNIEKTCDDIILSALESYVTTGDYEEFKSQLAELYITSDQVDIKISNVDSRISDIGKDTDSKFDEFYKYFEFRETGLSILESSGFELRLDSGMIQFMKDGIPFGWWDGVDFHTGNIVVEIEERAQFGNFAFVPRSDGSLQLLKVGGN